MMAGQPKNPADQQVPVPGCVPGDEVYLHHPKGPVIAKILAHGRHGITADVGGRQHKVKWEHVLGHRRRVAQELHVEDEGEDGMLVKDQHGRRHYVAIPPESREEMMVTKSLGARALFLKGIAPRPGLTEKHITDKNGVQTTRWVLANGATPSVGQHVGFKNGEHAGHGKVASVGAQGSVVRDKAGGEHRVLHQQVTHRWEGPGEPATGPDHDAQPDNGRKRPEVTPHTGNPDHFRAADFAKLHDDPSATPDSIINEFGGDAGKRVAAARDRLGGVVQTIEKHADANGAWNEQRAALHRKIIFDGVEVNGKKVPGLLAPERIKAATPPPGERPTFIALGGRGGSGKSSLNGLVYEESRAVVLDADHIKGMLPEYAGWNAHQVHEESSQVLEAVLAMAKILGVNVVLDATMKTGKSIEDKVDDFKNSGFRIEAHYMHLPRQEAAKRAVGRFLNGGEKGRFVPPEVVLGNTKNEENFDKIKAKADAWSFHDNSGEKGSGPKLIASKGDPGTVANQVLRKSAQTLILFTSKGGLR